MTDEKPPADGTVRGDLVLCARQRAAASQEVGSSIAMERLLYWTLFVAGVVLAAWLPAKSAYPDLGRQVAHILMRSPG